MKVIWSPLAVERATEQAEFIARDKPEAARRWLEGIFDSTASLAEFPQSGRQTPEFGDSAFRELLYGSYRVLYRIESGQITILTVRHSRRLLDKRELR